jgi:hypothetical protein
MPRVEPVECRALMSASPVRLPSVLDATPLDNGNVPLIDLGTGGYQGEDGGLYGMGSNTPPALQAARAAAAAAQIVPLDRTGNPRPDGKIGVLAIGQSTSRMIFSTFRSFARDLPGKSSRVALVNGAQDGNVLPFWSKTGTPWGVALGRLRAAGVSRAQVEVLWIDLAQLRAWKLGDFPNRIQVYGAEMTRVIEHAKALFPNAHIAFMSARIYGGYGPQGIDPEPYAYESGFDVRAVIERQEAGDPQLNSESASGTPNAPVLLWGPYLWANGTAPASTGLQWFRQDFVSDGIHPSASGRAKGAGQLANFFTSDPFAAQWFTT